MNFKLSHSDNYQKGRKKTIEYIVIHYTGNNGDTALNNVNYFAANRLCVSAHYFVDEKEIWQSVKDTDTAWHCGTTGTYRHPKCRNDNSIGIEMCSRKDALGRYYFESGTVVNAAQLVRELMGQYKIPIENVVRHYDVTGKLCPAPFVDKEDLWRDFKARLTVPQPIAWCVSEANLKAFVDAGIIVSPDYWQKEKIAYLDDLFTNSVKCVDKRVNNGIKDIDTAFEVLIDAGIIKSPDYWRGIIKSSECKYLKDLLINISNRCRIVLEKIVHAEACGEDEKGQVLVANVIMNRVKDKRYPNSIYDVVFEKNQFEPTRNGAYKKAAPSDSVKKAVTKALNGEDYSQGALYFCSVASASSPNSWHEKALCRLFTHKGHVFYK